MAISTRLTQRFGIEHPIINAPMAFAAGGELAAAVSAAGGLGLIGGGYGDPAWVEAQFDRAGNTPVGCGFIGWSLAENPGLLDRVLARAPRAIFLSFETPDRLAATVRDAGVPLIHQVQTVEDARRAIDQGADVIVAQGAEAGGHGEKRATMTLVPEVADLLAANAPDTLLCAAGGIADGRGVAASLMLGADGVVVGSRLWASNEAQVHPNMHRAAIDASGDATIRSQVMDIVRGKLWPERFTARVLRNGFSDEFHGREDTLRDQGDRLGPAWTQAWADGDVSLANTFVGEATGLIRGIEPAGKIVADMIEQAEGLLTRHR